MRGETRAAPRPTRLITHGKAGGRAPSLPASRPWGYSRALTHARSQLGARTHTHIYTQSAPRTVDTGTQAVLLPLCSLASRATELRQRQEGAPASTALGLLSSPPRGDGPKTGTRQWERFSGFGIPGGSPPPPVCFV